MTHGLVRTASEDPVGTWAHLRRDLGDIVYDEETASWYVLDEPSVRILLRDSRLRARGVPSGVMSLTAAAQVDVLPVERFLARWLVFSDPPHQRTLRRALAPALARTQTEVSTADIDEVLSAALTPDAVCGDLVNDVTRPLARLLTRRLLEVDEVPMEVLEEASEALIDYLATEGFDIPRARTARARLQDLRAVVDDLLAGDGRIAMALRPLLAEGRVEFDDVVAAYAQVLTGAMDPTCTALTASILRLVGSTAPPGDDHARRAVLEAALADEPPFHFAPRRSASELEVGGRRIPAGERVVLNLLAAGADLPDGEHLAFGGGTHYCLGAMSATDFIVRCMERLQIHGVVAMIDPSGVRRRGGFGMSGFTAVPWRRSAARPV
jgi:cytochrome P450